jgi:hypothetical protein
VVEIHGGERALAEGLIVGPADADVRPKAGHHRGLLAKVKGWVGEDAVGAVSGSGAGS